MELAKTAVVVATTEMVDAEVGDGVLVLHLENGRYFGLEEVAARIWTLLKTPVAVEDIERTLLEEYDVDAAQCHREVVTLVSELIEQGLVEVHK